MPWNTPKTDWISTDPVANSDLNRIEGNTKALKEEILEISGNKTFSGDNTHSGNDAISGTKTHNSILEGIVNYNNPILSGTAVDSRNKADSGNNVYTGDNDFSAATVHLPAGVAGIVPIGGIILWSGAMGDIPVNWHLCDGDAGTTDLQGRFVICAGIPDVGPAYNVGDTEAAPTHDHNAATGGHAITTAQMPDHGHEITDNGHYHSITDPGHVHQRIFVRSGTNATTLAPTSTTKRWHPTEWIDNYNTASATTGISETNGASTAISVNNSSGGGSTHDHPIDPDTVLPPYYALAYIQRIS